MFGFSDAAYDWLKFAHVLAAITWVGGNIALQVLATRIRHERDPQRLAVFAKDASRLGATLFTPAAILTLVTGVAAVAYSPMWDVGQMWVLLALVGIAVTIAIGAGFIGPESGRIGTLLDERGPDDAEAQSRLERLFRVGRVDLVVVVLVVADMVFKPGG